mmetsp:Transcript_1614/g.2757  ORF Transcript_1614/g.2757 Transcript_1614/m.2757 type:complete len:131 (-) Transcript_1614:316-708(-)|eukprot:CAMPEP_0197468520 /NCGR_PEP_ID=MMETSP1175-20131217/66123_1 /TAXON_ID=1003142 /ORGANISM="Triceratium dubium, Strain CCMP147" /LENGTH=130 /DNA_ID=CAMNT_0043004621 /DNA_START=154 /DNA_END=546 /DNA_ORIENTATION=+
MPYADPKFPVVNPTPTVDDCIKSMRIKDYFTLLGLTSASWAYGYVTGKPLRMPTAATAATIGLTAAGIAVLQNTRARLMGYDENAREVKMYGMHPTCQPRKVKREDARFPVATGRSSAAVSPPLNWRTYD